MFSQNKVKLEELREFQVIFFPCDNFFIDEAFFKVLENAERKLGLL